MFFSRKAASPNGPLPAHFLPRNSRLHDVLFNLPDNWQVRENLQIGHVPGCTVLVSEVGIFVLYPQDVSGVILHNPRSLIVSEQNLNPQLQMAQQSGQMLSRMLKERVHTVMLFKQLVEPEELKARALSPNVTREWEVENVKVVTWESLRAYILTYTRKLYTPEEVVALSRKIKDMSS
ncbi:hypothetical protein [Deinococcus roseus]|uniref:NERD domain-containing protein n=1 Tax=Deinococcus roseus TaxID=392414 RepID=A0ABQ2CX95_9DEIO|nr:hypothetical protein [Deinococcus roseus]GGJ30281.1 hypothetical protein GCM10008938_15370 [Deinococcus roseus]